jgi:hypothetical protein
VSETIEMQETQQALMWPLYPPCPAAVNMHAVCRGFRIPDGYIPSMLSPMVDKKVSLKIRDEP